MEEIEKELEAKSIERTDDVRITEVIEEKEPEPVISHKATAPKPKKERTEKQKIAFEKARKTRAENLKKKKEQEAKQKEEKKIMKKQIKQKVTEELTKPPPAEQVVEPKQYPIQGANSTATPYERVINNYYYYGVDSLHTAPKYEDPPQPPVIKKKKKVKRPPTPEPSSSSEEEYEEPEPEPVVSKKYDYGPPEEPDTYKELQQEQVADPRAALEQPKSNLKFRLA